MAPPFSFIQTLPPTGPQAPDHSRAFYEYAPALTLPHNIAQLNSANQNAAAAAVAAAAAANGHHRLNDPTAYALSSQFGREQLIQRNTLQPFVSSINNLKLFMHLDFISKSALFFEISRFKRLLEGYTTR